MAFDLSDRPGGYGYVRETKEEAFEFGEKYAAVIERTAYVYYEVATNKFFINCRQIKADGLNLLERFLWSE